MHRSSLRVAALAVALALGGFGCGGARARLVKVEGVLLLDGKPLPGATVRLTPLDAKGSGAYGLTREDGTFRLNCQNGAEGAFPGEYKVVIAYADSSQKAELPSDAKEAQRMADRMMRDMAKNPRRTKRPAKSSSAVPSAYTDEGRTPLRVTIPPPDGKLVLNL